MTATVLTDRLLTLLDNGVIEVYKYSTSEVCAWFICKPLSSQLVYIHLSFFRLPSRPYSLTKQGQQLEVPTAVAVTAEARKRKRKKRIN
jgi:hypothetical protein